MTEWSVWTHPNDGRVHLILGKMVCVLANPAHPHEVNKRYTYDEVEGHEDWLHATYAHVAWERVL